MIHDRGSKKWISLMLTEHVEMLKELWDDLEKKEKPILDEQEWALIEEVVQEAIEYGGEVKLIVYENGEFVCVSGSISEVDLMTKTLTIGTSNRVKFNSIVKAEYV